jgi:hypothetical protein
VYAVAKAKPYRLGRQDLEARRHWSVDDKIRLLRLHLIEKLAIFKLPVPRSPNEPIAIEWLSCRSLSRLTACSVAQKPTEPAQLASFQSTHP